MIKTKYKILFLTLCCVQGTPPLQAGDDQENSKKRKHSDTFTEQETLGNPHNFRFLQKSLDVFAESYARKNKPNPYPLTVRELVQRNPLYLDDFGTALEEQQEIIEDEIKKTVDLYLPAVLGSSEPTSPLPACHYHHNPNLSSQEQNKHAIAYVVEQLKHKHKNEIEQEPIMEYVCEDANDMPMHYIIQNAMKKYIDTTMRPDSLTFAEKLSLLYSLIEKRADNLAQLCIDLGADVNVHNDTYGKTPLHIATTYNKEDLINNLLAHGANINIQDKWNSTPLSRAVQADHLQLVKFLIEHGADQSIQDSIVGTPFMLAIYHDKRDIAQFLLEKGADVNTQNNRGWTALHYAEHNNNIPMVQLLLAHGADKTIRDDKDKTAYDYATTQKMKDLLRP